MSGFSGHAFLVGLPWVAVAILVVLAVTFVAGKRSGRYNVVDTSWGLFYVAAALAAYVASAGHGDTLRRGLLLALPAIWGLRLGVHVGRRSLGRGEDPRYAAMLDKAERNGHRRDLYALRMIYAFQGLLALLISAPLVVGMYEYGPVSVLGWVGVAVWAVGVLFEGVGDSQMERYKADKKAGRTDRPIMDRGLWRYTRHPNYFGDACVWTGMFLVAAERWPGVLTVFSPVIMTALLTAGSGVRILEAHMSKRDGWADYRERTSIFFPLPPALTRRLRRS